jgi:hypothetical protein
MKMAIIRLTCHPEIIISVMNKDCDGSGGKLAQIGKRAKFGSESYDITNFAWVCIVTSWAIKHASISKSIDIEA